jgi:hypothetical protein
MTKTLILGILLFLVTSCSKESFISFDPTEFNDFIAWRTDIRNPEGLIKLFYNDSDLKELDYSCNFTDTTIHVNYIIKAKEAPSGAYNLVYLFEKNEEGFLFSEMITIP